ncbi:MAG TPA: peptidoglycan-binding domain-containing protein [Polyangia bacterium]|jgi:peptidoglycan hydrolase-like protein with peptidoglycan-binding domain|nr:peptidoglycan-binding domain-containing protein [Polyangia bacterium]
MKRAAWFLATALTVGYGCGHTKSVGPAVPPAEEEARAQDEEKKAEGDKKDEGDGKAADVPKEKKTTTAATFTSHHKSDAGDGKEREADVRLSTSPTALLKPGAVQSIQEKLAHSGELSGEPSGKMDAATQKALTEFQRHHDLPATGVPDDATVGRLGLKPSDIFRSAGTP